MACRTKTWIVAEVQGKVVLQKQEIHDGKWVSIPQAFNQITHQEGKDLLSKVEKILPKL